MSPGVHCAVNQVNFLRTYRYCIYEKSHLLYKLKGSVQPPPEVYWCSPCGKSSGSLCDLQTHVQTHAFSTHCRAALFVTCRHMCKLTPLLHNAGHNPAHCAVNQAALFVTCRHIFKLIPLLHIAGHNPAPG
jgi:hypothetical protein